MSAEQNVKSRKRARQVDVAKRAGVSTAVVSRVLNSRSNSSIRVSKATERRVWEAVRELGYVPNLVAQSLVKGERLLLGVFTFEPVFTARQRGFYVPFLLGIEREAEANSYDLLLFTSTSGSARRRSAYRDGSNRLGLADGAILLGREPDKRDLKRLLAERYPFVFIGRREVPGARVPYVAADYAAATDKVLLHLAAMGHGRFALLSSNAGYESSVDRRIGYARAYRAVGAPAREVDESIFAASVLTPEWLRALVRSGVTALLAENDVIGRSVLGAAASGGVAIPEDLSLAVLGDPVGDPHDVPDWVSFEIPRLEMGREAVRLLLSVIAGAPAEEARLTLPCTLVQGKTAAPPRNRPVHRQVGHGR